MTVKGGNNGKFPILRSDIRGVGITKIGKPEHSAEATNALCIEAVEGPLEDYRLLLHIIVDSGLNRYNR